MSETTSILPILSAVKKAAKAINRLSNERRVAITNAIAGMLLNNQQAILAANTFDLAKMEPTNPLYDRLLLNESRLLSIADATRQVAALPNPVGKKLSHYEHPNGLQINKYTVPLGVVGAIYEARPNVTIDISALCLRSGNAVVLKGGSDAEHTNLCLATLIQQVLTEHGLPPEVVTLLSNDRAVVHELLSARDFVDVIIPRGSQRLIDYVREHATVPVIETGAGVCHSYVHEKANLSNAAAIVVNAKTQRPSVCNALDTVLVDETIASTFLPMLLPGFVPFEVFVHADEKAYEILQLAGYPHLQLATADSFGREYLSQQCSIKTVSGLSEALEHIADHSSRHSEAIITEDASVAETFLHEVDAAAVYLNASTRFTDGGEFGLGAELGISTQKLHARGPFALEKMVCEKWVVRGSGQVR